MSECNDLCKWNNNSKRSTTVTFNINTYVIYWKHVSIIKQHVIALAYIFKWSQSHSLYCLLLTFTALPPKKQWHSRQTQADRKSEAKQRYSVKRYFVISLYTSRHWIDLYVFLWGLVWSIATNPELILILPLTLDLNATITRFTTRTRLRRGFWDMYCSHLKYG